MSNTSFNQKGVSLYYQVETYIRTKIESGEWPSGFKLPTETELCQYFGVSRTTIRQAVNKMVEGGLLMRKQVRHIRHTARLFQEQTFHAAQ